MSLKVDQRDAMIPAFKEWSFETLPNVLFCSSVKFLEWWRGKEVLGTGEESSLCARIE